MKSMKNQNGSANLLSLIFAIIIMTSMVMAAAEMASVKSRADDKQLFRDNLAYIIKQVNAYQADIINALGTGAGTSGVNFLPASWSNLTPAYIPNCSAVQFQNRQCRRYQSLPWGSEIQLTRVVESGVYKTRLAIPFPVLNDATAEMHNDYRAALAFLPGSSFNQTLNQGVINIERLGEELSHDALVKRSGQNSTLTGDWDVGGAASIHNINAIHDVRGIYDVDNITIRISSSEHRNLAAGPIGTLTAYNAQSISRHNCPSGLTPDISTSIKGIFRRLASTPEFSIVGASRAYHTGSGPWTVNLEYFAIRKSDSQWATFNDGEIEVTRLCK